MRPPVTMLTCAAGPGRGGAGGEANRRAHARRGRRRSAARGFPSTSVANITATGDAGADIIADIGAPLAHAAGEGRADRLARARSSSARAQRALARRPAARAPAPVAARARASGRRFATAERLPILARQFAFGFFARQRFLRLRHLRARAHDGELVVGVIDRATSTSPSRNAPPSTNAGLGPDDAARDLRRERRLRRAGALRPAR